VCVIEVKFITHCTLCDRRVGAFLIPIILTTSWWHTELCDYRGLPYSWVGAGSAAQGRVAWGLPALMWPGEASVVSHRVSCSSAAARVGIPPLQYFPEQNKAIRTKATAAQCQFPRDCHSPLKPGWQLSSMGGQVSQRHSLP